MLNRLHLKNLGPAPEMDFHFGSRLNMLTGDNGLGKSFALETAWFALTRTWAGIEARPSFGDNVKLARIQWEMSGITGASERKAKFDLKRQEWRLEGAAKPAIPGVVVYARVDGGFSVWDPARNYSKDQLNVDDGTLGTNGVAAIRPASFQFNRSQVWEGQQSISNGFIRDVEHWRLKGEDSWKLLDAVTQGLSPSEEELLKLGPAIPVGMDVLDIPVIESFHGPIPVTYASAGMKRILALAYMLVWTWIYHCRASKIRTSILNGNGRSYLRFSK